MKILIADKFEQSGIDGLKAASCDVRYEPDLKDEALTAAIRTSGAEVLVVRGTPVTAPMLDAGRLSLIVRAGAGYNTIDVAAASKRGIYVSNCPGKNAIAVAELAFALMLAIDRRIPENVADLRTGIWNKQEYSKSRGLYGSTLALLGVGAIGREVIRRAAGFGINIVIWSRRFDGQDRPLSEEDARELGIEGAQRQVAIQLVATPGDAAWRADVLSVHVALTPATTHLVNAAVLAQLKPGATVINTSRGEVIDHAALATAIREKGLKVGLDVFSREPATVTGGFGDPIVSMAGVYGTHHIGGSTDQAQEAIAAETVRIIRRYKETGR
ncbi:MAG: NAD(P)-dependent oxidoreductase, partial [Vicinamibacterales bacterium]